MGRRRQDDGSERRSEVVTVRVDPKLKYLAELAARKQRRSLSRYVEWVIRQSLNGQLDITS
jgi:predicted HicB family RNase H-like nuclease